MEDRITPSLRTARIICGALISAVVVFWAMAFALKAGPGPFASDLTIDARVPLAISIAVALGAFVAALFFRYRALGVVSGGSRRDSAASLRDLSILQRNLTVAWALLEGQAMVAGVFFLLVGAASLLIVSMLVSVIGFALTFPRAEWFERVLRSSATQS